MTASVSTHYCDDHTTLYTADAATGIAALPDECIDCLITSPPYWRLRDYTAPDHVEPGIQIGLESTAEDYIDQLRQVFTAARRALTPRATVWINLGDSYATNTDGYARTARGRQPTRRPRTDLPHKNLVGMPWRVAFALQDDGWILRSAIVWHKPNAAPHSVRDRLTNRYEMLFLFAANNSYHFDLDPIRQPYTGRRSLAQRARRRASKPNSIPTAWPPTPEAGVRGRNPGDVWTIPTAATRTPHPTPSPLDIPRRAIAAGCPNHGTVLDPFSGSGATGLAARQLGRTYIGIDTNPAYHALAVQRLNQDHCDTCSSKPGQS